MSSYPRTDANDVLGVLRAHRLLDGFPFVLDLGKSHGSWLVDANTGEQYLDLYTFFASAPARREPQLLHRRSRISDVVGRRGGQQTGQ